MENVLWFLVVILFIWIAAMTYLLMRALANYNRLTEGVTEKTLSEILTNFLKQDALLREELKHVRDEMRKIRQEGMHAIQKVGVVRFNPFSDTGGDQSFVLTFLDGNDSGIIMTSLYARTGMRWYIKTIRTGKGIEHELSKEEVEALKKAKKAG